MERPNFDMLSERLNIDIADRAESDSSIGFKSLVRSGTYFSQNKGTMMKTNCMAIGGDLKF
jgi:hypothetical protein